VLDAVADPPEGRDPGPDRVAVAGGGVRLDAAGPQLEASAVDLGRRPMPEPQVEPGGRHVQRGEAGGVRAPGADRRRERPHRAAHLGLDPGGHRPPPKRRPGRPDGVGLGRGGRPVAGPGGVERGVRGVRDGRELSRGRSGQGVDGHGQGHGLEIAARTGQELAVAWGEELALGGPVLVELARPDRPGDRAARPGDPDADALDDHLLEDHPGRVLGPEGVAHARAARHDHRRRTLAPREPRAVRVGDGAVLVVEDVLAQVPYGAVIGLGVAVERDLVKAPVEVGDVLRLERLDPPAVPADGRAVRQQRRLGAEALPVDPAQQEGRAEPGDREERVGDAGRGRERRRAEVRAGGVRGERQPRQAAQRRLGDRVLAPRRAGGARGDAQRGDRHARGGDGGDRAPHRHPPRLVMERSRTAKRSAMRRR